MDEELLRRFEEAKRFSIISRIGNTPCIKLDRLKKILSLPENINIWGKVEGLNPGGVYKR
jgi:Cysteine synthase